MPLCGRTRIFFGSCLSCSRHRDRIIDITVSYYCKYVYYIIGIIINLGLLRSLDKGWGDTLLRGGFLGGCWFFGMCVLHNKAAIHYVQWAVPYVEVSLHIDRTRLYRTKSFEPHKHRWHCLVVLGTPLALGADYPAQGP